MWSSLPKFPTFKQQETSRLLARTRYFYKKMETQRNVDGQFWWKKLLQSTHACPTVTQDIAELSNMCFTCLVEAWHLSDFRVKFSAFENRKQLDMALCWFPVKNRCALPVLCTHQRSAFWNNTLYWTIRRALPLALGRRRQEDPEFRASQGDIWRTYFKINKSSRQQGDIWLWFLVRSHCLYTAHTWLIVVFKFYFSQELFIKFLWMFMYFMKI